MLGQPLKLTLPLASLLISFQWNEYGLWLLPDHPNSEGYEKIVTHNDFDGIVSASLCSWVLKIQKGDLYRAPHHCTLSNHDHRERCGL